MQLDIALTQLQQRAKCDELVFWGKVCGLNNDYYIAVGVTYKDMYEFPNKTFYWTLGTNFDFREMPSLTEQHDEVINKDQTYFTGDPRKLIVNSKPEGEEGEEEAPVEEEEEGEEGEEKAKDSDESEEEEIKVPKRDLTGKYILHRSR